MKRSPHSLLIILIISLLVTSFILLGCANAAVETAISDFKNAVNNDSVSEIQNALSPASSFYITQEFETFLDYFDGNRPVEYSNYTITAEGANADAYANSTYSGVTVSGGVWFWFRREETFLSFLFPSYKVYRYYDNGDWNNPVWKKLQEIGSQ
jgi:uncharacterized membrane protein YvbJ